MHMDFLNELNNPLWILVAVIIVSIIALVAVSFRQTEEPPRPIVTAKKIWYSTNGKFFCCVYYDAGCLHQGFMEFLPTPELEELVKNGVKEAEDLEIECREIGFVHKHGLSWLEPIDKNQEV